MNLLAIMQYSQKRRHSSLSSKFSLSAIKINIFCFKYASLKSLSNKRIRMVLQWKPPQRFMIKHTAISSFAKTMIVCMVKFKLRPNIPIHLFFLPDCQTGLVLNKDQSKLNFLSQIAFFSNIWVLYSSGNFPTQNPD